MVVLRRGPLVGLAVALTIIVLSVGGLGIVAWKASRDATAASRNATSESQNRISDQRAACWQNGRSTVADINLNWFQSLTETDLARLLRQGTGATNGEIGATLSERARLEAKAALAKTARVDVRFAPLITYAQPRDRVLKTAFSCARAYPEVPSR